MQKALILICMMNLIVPAIAIGDECVEGDCVNGKGTMVSSTGHKYTGEFKDGVRHGEGVMLLPGGRKLVGVWSGNEIRTGTYTAPDGTIYEGQWEHRERNGQGALTFPDGRKYVGEFKSGQRHGRGTMTWPDGRTYVGDFKQGARTGQGTMAYPDGRTVTGEFKDGEFLKK
ncbi:MAG: 2-isopropylmalate synthase [Desulfobacteraceae bacterium]|nr:2-isopropylmalate synthase [Desulfobacteraceae bacterium]